MFNFINTDLAVEIHESYSGNNVEIDGVEIFRERNESGNIRMTRVAIKSEESARKMNKPEGLYITLDCINKANIYEEMNDALYTVLFKMLQRYRKKQILVAGLGNPYATPDSLGPDTVSKVNATRHLINIYGKDFQNKNNMFNVATVIPGVLIQTGMESVDIIKSLVKENNIGLVIVIDALSARMVKRLSSTIQITNTGINPGKGVGNNRSPINKKVLGCDVIAIGVPTVIDMTTIVSDIMGDYEYIEEAKYYEFMMKKIKELEKDKLYVTSKDIDEEIAKMSEVIAMVLNKVFGF
ncbi:MAG: GPR endopeptidase [Lachnospiraceae bacterium]|nr:GPR endopeptidase [Lachnospiraceae bacterium]